MTYNLQNYKVEVFPNINDTPIEPTATKAGNGSHLIQQFNDVVDETEAGLNSLEEYCDSLSRAGAPRWLPIIETYTAEHGQRILYLNNPNLYPETTIDLHLYPNPQVGDWIEIFKLTRDYRINLYGYLGIFNGISYYNEVYIAKETVGSVSLIYCGNDYLGWVTNNQTMFTGTVQNS